MTPSFIGLIATMLPGVRPSMSFASLPTASTRPFTLLIATIEGSLTTIPLPRAYTQVFAVPRSIARSLEKSDSIERRLIGRSQKLTVNSSQLRGNESTGPSAILLTADDLLTFNCELSTSRIGEADEAAHASALADAAQIPFLPVSFT